MGELDQGIAALDSGDVARANQEIDDFRRDWTDVEGLVKAKSSQVYTDTENNMAKASTLLTIQPPDAAQARAIMLRMKADLAPIAAESTRYGIFDAAIILFREGLEALLVVGATLAFLQRSGNGDKARWIWAGSGAGVVASLIIALVINIVFAQASMGQNREVLEGVTGLVAAAMLIYVSFWMHSKANLSAWHRYVGLKTMTALARKSLVSLGLISFLAVFREGSETALFYLGIAPSISFGDLVTGLAAGAIGLAAIGVVMFVFGVNLPIRPFFLTASALVYYLAFKFVGTGIHALQVGGVLRATSADYLPSNDFVGLYPTWETTAVQIALLVLVAAVPAYYYVRSLLNRSQTERRPRPELTTAP
jgi:high-affinity iron transporter